MFEFEASQGKGSLDELPYDVLRSFESQYRDIKALTLINWEEHCTECAMPACYKTCDLYRARKDGHCRRFVEGIVPIGPVHNAQGYVVRIDFKAWGELVGSGSSALVPREAALKIEKTLRTFDQFASAFPDGGIRVAGRRGPVIRGWHRIKKQQLKRVSTRKKEDRMPSDFLVEVFNPSDDAVHLSIAIRNPEHPKIPYQQMLTLTGGYHREYIKYQDIADVVGHGETWEVVINPNLTSASSPVRRLYFGILGFVERETLAMKFQEARGEISTKPYLKVAVWDLDGTMWNGILIEDGFDGLSLNTKAVDLVRLLDSRGIVNSIISKNNPEDAIDALNRFGISDLFVFPKFGWDPKPTFMRQLFDEFDVSPNTFAFIDDSDFERDHMISLIPEVRVYGVDQVPDIADDPAFNPPQSTSSRNRRAYYEAKSKRDAAAREHDGEYIEFLKKCEIAITITSNVNPILDRVHELVQRTNQLNYSGNRYSRAEISAIVSDTAHDCYAISCTDRYGDYGVVGFCVVDRTELILKDLMFSCRVRSKNIEHAFITWLIHHYMDSKPGKMFSAACKDTGRNTAALQVFNDLMFTLVREDESRKEYAYQKPSAPPVQAVIALRFDEGL
jgi:FkbH-like protein